MSIFGSISRIFKGKKQRKKLNRSEAIVIRENGLGSGAESYNHLKDNILYASNGGKIKVIQIESSVSGEGKTTVACNLAVSLGLNDKKILLVDLDFRRPRVHQLFGMPIENGISELMLGNANLDGIIKTTKYKNVDIITRGAKIHNSSLVLTSDTFKNMFEELREKYDFIIIDAAPVLQISDYIHISQISDSILFLVAHGITKRGEVKEAIKEMRRNDVKILGAMFTMFDPSEKYGGYYGKYYGKKYGNYGYGYGSYYGYGDEETEFDVENKADKADK